MNLLQILLYKIDKHQFKRVINVKITHGAGVNG